MLPGPWPRVTKRSTGDFTGSTSHLNFVPSKFPTSISRAVYEGAQGTDCSIRFASPGRFSPVKAHFISEIFLFSAKGCDLFPWQRQDFMNTQYEHVEL